MSLYNSTYINLSQTSHKRVKVEKMTFPRKKIKFDTLQGVSTFFWETKKSSTVSKCFVSHMCLIVSVVSVSIIVHYVIVIKKTSDAEKKH